MVALQQQAFARIQAALRPRTASAYSAGFRQFLAFTVKMCLDQPHEEAVLLLYLEYLAQQGLKSNSIRNQVSILKHYFALLKWPTQVFNSRNIQMLIKSVQRNSVIAVKLKGVIDLKMLKKLVRKTRTYTNGEIFAAVFTVAFFGFFRLSTLLPNKSTEFDGTRFPVQNDLVFGPPGVHMIVTCSKTMQNSNEMQVVQLPNLIAQEFCPVMALKKLLKIVPQGKNLPDFQIITKRGWMVLTAPRVRSFLKLVITSMGLNPSTYTTHAFRRSGASLAFDNNIELSKIKQHGSWKSEAIWTYLRSTPKAASAVPRTFQQLMLNTL